MDPVINFKKSLLKYNFLENLKLDIYVNLEGKGVASDIALNPPVITHLYDQ
jgi:hypothetical protein